jgi:hypothetical protein
MCAHILFLRFVLVVLFGLVITSILSLAPIPITPACDVTQSRRRRDGVLRESPVGEFGGSYAIAGDCMQLSKDGLP